jgi:hypothetical protein
MNFDLDIQHYKKSELEEIFELPPNYDARVIEMKVASLRDSIVKNSGINESVRVKTISFLLEAKKRLLESSVDSLISLEKGVFHFDTTSLRPSKVNLGTESFIMEKGNPSTPYLNAKPGDYFPGLLNPIEKRITRQYLNIDTRFRTNYYNSQSTNFQIDIPNKFSNVVSMQLSAFEFPTTFFNISKALGTNFFNVIIGSDTKQIVVPDGNYIPSEIVSFLNNYVSVEFVGTLFQYITFGVDVYNQSGSGRLLVALNSDTPNPFSFTLDFQADINGNPDESTPLPMKLGWMLGFRQGIYVNNVTYMSEGMVDLIGIKYLYLAIDEYSNSVNDNFYAAFTDSVLNKNILARISVQGLSFQSLSQNNFILITHPRQYFGPIDITTLKIQLLDEYGRIIQLNNMDYSLCLTFESVYNL